MISKTRIMLLVSIIAVILAFAGAGAYYWTSHIASLSIAVGPVGSPEQRFAVKLATVLQQNKASIRLTVLAHDTQAQALNRFVRREADFAILRTDSKIPSHARAIAVLENEALLLFGGHGGKLKSLAGLAGKRVAVMEEDSRNEVLIQQILGQDHPGTPHVTLQSVASSADIEKLLGPGGYDFVIALAPISQIAGKSFGEWAQHIPELTLYGVSEAGAIQRRLPALHAETIEAGLVSEAPKIPEENIDTVALQKVLVARNKTQDSVVIELMKFLFENKSDLSIDDTFGTRIEQPDVEKDSFIVAHTGARQYVDDDIKSFFDRYSDLLYLGMSVASIIGSICFALFTGFTRVRPEKAGDRAHDLLEVTDKIRAVRTTAELDIAETELEDILREVLRGLKLGTISANGLDAFRMTYEHARDAIKSARQQFVQ